jgi:hypothetical protein
MSDLNMMFDAFIGYLVGMALVEVIVKPTIVRFSKKALSSLDDRVSWVPDFLHGEEEPK